MALPLDADNLNDLSIALEDLLLHYLDQPATEEERQIKIKVNEAIFWTTEARVIADRQEFER